MENKTIIKISIIAILVIVLFYLFYFIFIRPYVIGTYQVTENDCKKVTECVCLKNSCNCQLKKWFTKNQIVCDKSTIQENQIAK